MSNTLTILGIDAADYALCHEWGCSNLLLDRDQKLESFAHSTDVPATLEVWPSIATGQRPTEHGVLLNAEDRDTGSSLYRLAVSANKALPDLLSDRIRALKEQQVGTSFPQTSAQTIFTETGGTAYNWPGVTPCHDWDREGEWFQSVIEGDLPEQEFYRRQLGDAGKGVGWLAAQAQADVPVAGAHIHILDHMGHLYGERPEKLRQSYDAVDELVGWLQERVDSLIIISDHGMQSTAVDSDDDPGVHSWRAMVAATDDIETLPDGVLDVYEWLLMQINDEEVDETTTTVDAPMEHLKDLGYL
ncbi:alkaline phosphatase family protein [Halosolutus halophilus]|uniref:alkaline phosphatase family protein n=1 Tax=Halosolutus halophilus TaxID=1552990 RepID=UPI00223518EE|nr:alkaline phosphatase family protein [Halosolutus halophilus]